MKIYCKKQICLRLQEKFTVLATEIFKVKNGFSQIIMNKVFNFQENKTYNLTIGINLASKNVHSAHFGIDTKSSSGPRLWKLIELIK